MITCLVFGRLFSPRGALTRFRVMASTYGASRSHSLDTPHSLWLLWTSDQSVAETSLPDTTQYSQQISMPTADCELAIPASEWPQTHVLRPRGHWDWLCLEDAWLKQMHSLDFRIQVYILFAAIAMHLRTQMTTRYAVYVSSNILALSRNHLC